MKKTYFAPEIKVVTIQFASSMLAGSPTMTLNKDEEDEVEGGAALSPRGGSLWDDDEDEGF